MGAYRRRNISLLRVAAGDARAPLADSLLGNLDSALCRQPLAGDDTEYISSPNEKALWF
jgi:hypothetical protein